MYNRSNISGSTNQRSDKRGRQSDHIPFKHATGTKPSVSLLCLLFFPCVVRKATANVVKKALNICHQAQKGFRSIFVGIPEHKKGYWKYPVQEI